MAPTTTYAETIARIENYTAALRYMRAYPASVTPRGTLTIERYLNLLSAKARAQFAA
jgi:hypothetical protein